MVRSAARCWTEEIAEALRPLIVASFPTLKVCQFGLVERLAASLATSKTLPAVLIKPEEVTYEAVNEAGTGFLVSDRFRICYAQELESTDDPIVEMVDAVQAIVGGLSADATLPDLRDTIGPDQVVESRPEGVEWFPAESVFLAEMQSPIRVVVIRWLVLWRNPGA